MGRIPINGAQPGTSSSAPAAHLTSHISLKTARNYVRSAVSILQYKIYLARELTRSSTGRIEIMTASLNISYLFIDEGDCKDGPDPNRFCSDTNKSFCTRNTSYKSYFLENCKKLCNVCSEYIAFSLTSIF